MERKLLSFLGIARKAGKLCLGQDVAAESIRSGNAALLVLSNDISGKSGAKIRRFAEEFAIPILQIPAGMDQLEQMLGKRAGILAVTDAGFAKRILELARESGIFQDETSEEEISTRKQGEEHAI